MVLANDMIHAVHGRRSGRTRLACTPAASPFPLSASGTLRTGQGLQARRIRLVLLQVTFCSALRHPTTRTPTRRAGCKVISWAPHCKTPPAIALTFSFSSLIPTFSRPAASTVCCHFPTLLHPSCARKFFIPFSTVRTYASAKKKKMPPKKAVKEEKVLLGRPGNSLKSGIVSERPAVCRCRVLTLTVVARSA